MKDNFEDLPRALRNLILLRVGISGLCVLTFLMFLCYSYRWEFLFPFFAITCLLVISTWQLFYRCTDQRYVTVHGVCTEINRTWLRKHVKSVTISEGSSMIKILGTELPIRHIRVGDSVKIYIAENVPVYDSDGCKIICSSMAIMREDM